jgi:hypothetical protein
MSLTFSAASAGSHSASKEPECEPSRSARSTPIANECSESTGQMSRSSKTSETCEQLTFLPLMSSAAAFPANRSQVLREDATAVTVISGQKCAELFRNAGPLGSFVRMLLTSTDWESAKWWLIWRGSDTRSRRRLKFRLVPSDTITGGRASGFVATPTAKANQSAPSMTKWRGCLGIDLTPEMIERRMGYPVGWTDLEH